MSKTERIERLEQQVHELQEKLDAINMLHSDIVDLQQFKRFIELSNASRNRILSQNDAK